MSSSSMTTVIENCRISPPPGAVVKLSLPLTFLDMLWLPHHPIRRLLFYEFPCSKASFLETLVPKLKHSLSHTLKHYFPLAGNLLYHTNNEIKPIIRYVPGDSVLLTISECTNDFDHFVGNHVRDSDPFYDFVPQLPPPTDQSDYKLLPVLALQVTLFPGRGLCFGLTNHHVIGDASSIVGFIRTWAETNKLEGFLDKPAGKFLPLFDRSLLKDPLGIDSIYWNQMKWIPLKSDCFPLPTNRVRATYILHPSEIKKLKDLVMAKRPSLVHVSSFVVTSAYVWTCLVKSFTGEDDKVPDYFVFVVDCRSRLDPPLPANYFGNILSLGLAEISRKELAGNDGFFMAAEAIARDIQERVNDKDQVLKGAENWVADHPARAHKVNFSVAGSPKFDLYGTDFGWGKARKMEALSIDEDGCTMSLCTSRDFEGGLEVGLSLKKTNMDSFAGIFADGIKG